MNQPPFDPKSQLLALLTQPDPVSNWNTFINSYKHLVNFDNCDFEDYEIPKIDFSDLSFQSANFREARLQGANLCGILCWKAGFVRANLEKAKCLKMDARNSDFSEANLKGANLDSANLGGALFLKADLSEAVLRGSNIEGANFKGATITTTDFKNARFNEQTEFPVNYVPSRTMIWTGKKKDDPRPSSDEEVTTSNEIADYDSLMRALFEKFEAEKIQRALGMLQSETFHLFADITDDTVVGVARSQTKEERVYSCSLSSSGAYGCCTQNLRHCGALRGSACKHIFLLLLVLTKNGSMEPLNAYEWLVSSIDHKPTIDKDLMTKTFLRYKGAEDGEIDWRPIETTPEDYYAL